MQILAPQDLALISGGLDSYSFDDIDEDASFIALTLKGSLLLATEGSNFIDEYIESPYFQTAAKIGLYSTLFLFNAAVMITEITRDNAE